MKPRPLYIILLLVLGAFSAYLFIPFVHEAGHYSVACLYNCSAVTEFIYQPEVSLLKLFPSAEFSGYAVRYSGNLKEIYGDYGILVYLAGFIFEMVLFSIIVFILNRQKNFIKNKNRIYVFSFLFGFFVAFINSTFSWLLDFYSLLALYFNLEKEEIKILSYILMISFYLIWLFFCLRFWKALKKHLPKKKAINRGK